MILRINSDYFLKQHDQLLFVMEKPCIFFVVRTEYSILKKNPMSSSSDGGDSGSKKCKGGYGGAYGGIWRSLRLA
jgi:hypothetical protein